MREGIGREWPSNVLEVPIQLRASKRPRGSVQLPQKLVRAVHYICTLYRAMRELALRNGQVDATHLTRDHHARRVALKTTGLRLVGILLAARHTGPADNPRPDAALLACLKGGCSKSNAHGPVSTGEE